jgi:Holliday junction resolvase RusA-like endonuclease
VAWRSLARSQTSTTLQKPFLDAMNGVIFKDDTQVIDLHVKKLYSTFAGVDVMVMEAK